MRKTLDQATKDAEAVLTTAAGQGDTAMSVAGSVEEDRHTQVGDDENLSEEQIEKMVNILPPHLHARLAARLVQPEVQSDYSQPGAEAAGLPARSLTRSRSDHRLF